MKHIPNLLTICNLVCGCLAIVYILNAPSFLNTVDYETFRPVIGVHQILWGSVFIGLAAIFDVFDGMAARVLNAHSYIGKDLDSLADVISFGVAPSMIMYQLLWSAYMSEPGAMDIPTVVFLPAFALAAFAALRLARFNQTNTQQKFYFIGMPVPATGIVVAALPVMMYFEPQYVSFLSNRWVLYIIIALLAFFMVSNLKFLKWKSSGVGLKAWWPQIVIAVVFGVSYALVGMVAVLIAFVVYVLLAFVYKHEDAPVKVS